LSFKKVTTTINFVIGIFKQKTPTNALILLFYALVLKFPSFLHPVPALQLEGDNFIYKLVLNFFDVPAKNFPLLYPLLSFIIVFTQATLLNKIANNLRLIQKPNYLVGMAYIIVTSLIKEWSIFSAPLLINSLLIAIWFSMIGWYNNKKPKTAIFNTSILVGVLPLIYSPAVAFIVLLFLGLLVIRPLLITEWFVALLGFMSPYYFLFVVLFLNSSWSWNRILPDVNFHLPKLPGSLWLTGGIIILVLPFLIGSYYVQEHLNKMLIQVRKSWSLLLVLLLVALIIVLLNPGNSFVPWIFLAIPLAAFQAAAFNYLQGKWFVLLLHWVIVGFVIALQYTQ
jgi:hypothetical protein